MCQLAVDCIVIAPDDFRQKAVGDVCLDFVAVQPEISLHVDTVAAASDRAMVVNLTCAVVLVEHGADNRASGLPRKSGNPRTDNLHLRLWQRSQSLL